MPTYPLPTLAPTIDSTGILAPSYTDIYQSLVASFKAIYGSDIYIDPDSQDGQWIAILAQGYFDVNQAVVAAYQSFAPDFAQGAGLSSLVKLNGLKRNVSSYSTTQGDVVGVAGTVVTNGQVRDQSSNLWLLPTPITIPTSGLINVTATCVKAGAIQALAGSINQIASPQLGWQSFINTTTAVPGAAVETDAELRARQKLSIAFPAQTIKEAIYSAIGNVSGVSRFTIAENDTGTTNADGVPSHSISVVTKGGSPTDIVNAIALRKPPGIQTYGLTTLPVTDSHGLTTQVSYFPLAETQIYFTVNITKLAGYVDTTGAEIISQLVAFVNALEIGEDVYFSQAMAAASLSGQSLGATFYITSFALGVVPAPVGTANIPVAFNAAAACLNSNVALVVV